jgi:hypothetical protein
LTKWTVAFHDEFEPEFDKLPAEVQDELLAEAAFIELFGPLTGRPHVDKLHGSDYANMKELRFEAMNDEWRVAFAFDPKQIAILLVAGGKAGISEKKFYKALIAKAEARFKRHLARVKAETETGGKGRKR